MFPLLAGDTFRSDDDLLVIAPVFVSHFVECQRVPHQHTHSNRRFVAAPQLVHFFDRVRREAEGYVVLAFLPAQEGAWPWDRRLHPRDDHVGQISADQDTDCQLHGSLPVFVDDIFLYQKHPFVKGM